MQRILRELDPPRPSTRLSTLSDLPSVAARRRVEAGLLPGLIRGDLDWIVLKCLERDRSRRYATANGLAADLTRHLAGEPVLAAPPGVVYRLRKFARRNRGPLLGVAGVLAALVLGMAGTTAGLIRAQRAGRAEALQHRQAAEAVAFMQKILAGAGPWIAVGRDSAILAELMDESARKIEAGELRGNPEAEVVLRTTIGATYIALARFEAADLMLTQALALGRSRLPRDHVAIAACLDTLGQLRLEGYGNVKDAESLCREALDMRRRLFRGDNPDIATSLNNVAFCVQAAGRPADALPGYQESLEMRRRLFKGDHPDVAESLSNLGYCLSSLERWNEALEQHDDALSMRRRLFRGDHPDVALSLNNLGAVLVSLNRTADALPLCREALAMYRRLLGRDHPILARSLVNVAHCLQSLGQHADAEPLLRECLYMRERLLASGRPFPQWTRFHTMSLLAGSLLAQDKLDEAESLLLRAVESLLSDPEVPATLIGKAGPRQQVLQRLIDLYERRNTLEPGKGFDYAAARWRNRGESAAIAR